MIDKLLWQQDFALSGKNWLGGGYRTCELSVPE
jgi:hypothetical protein